MRPLWSKRVHPSKNIQPIMNTDANARNAKSFVDRLMCDEAMMERLKSQEETPAAIESFIKAEGFECTFEEVSTVLRDRLGDPEKGDDKALSHKELEGVAGGGFPGMYYTLNTIRLREQGLLFNGANPGEEVLIHRSGS